MAVSFGIELTVVNLFTSKDNEENFYNLKVLLSKRCEKSFTSHKVIENHRLEIFFFIYVIITKVNVIYCSKRKILTLLNWNIWEIIFIPLFTLSCPLVINYCSEILKDFMEENKFVDDTVFSMKINMSTEQTTFPILSLRNKIGIASLLVFPLTAYKITSEDNSDYYGITIMMTGIIHFTPFFLKRSGKKTKMEWLVIVLSLNLGIIRNLSILATIISNMILYIYVNQIKKHIIYFRTFQYFLMAIAANTIIIFKEIGTPTTIEIFCETHTLALLFYIALTLFLALTLLSPPRFFIKNIELSKTLIPFIGACYLLISLMLVEEANTAPGFLRETYLGFHQNLKIFNSLIIVVTVEFMAIIKIINYCDHRFDDIPRYLDIPESSYVELGFLSLKNYTHEEVAQYDTKFFKDRYYANVLLKFSDITLVFSTIIINVIFTEGGWARFFLNIMFGLIYTGKRYIFFVKKLNLIFFSLEMFLTYLIPTYLNSILDSFYYLFGSPFLKAAVLHFKSRSFTPSATSIINLPSIYGPSSFVEEDDPNWKTNWVVFFLIVIPLNILSIYIEGMRNQKAKKIQKRNWEFVVVKKENPFNSLGSIDNSLNLGYYLCKTCRFCIFLGFIFICGIFIRKQVTNICK